MSTFGAYARYYDLLYRDKDYAGEAQFVRRLLLQHAPALRSVLELGCGTGHHAALLAAEGLEVHGVDRSDEMLAQAAERRLRLTPELAQQVSFSTGDVRTLRLGRQFDAVVSLFHVMSYQTSNADLGAAFETARAHLRPGGLFLFDCWYGPAVLTDRPSARQRTLEDARTAVTRFATPVLRPEANVCDVHYRVSVADKLSGAVEELREVHSMRYLFTPEIDLLFDRVGLRRLAACEWLSARPAAFDTWSVCFVGQA